MDNCSSLIEQLLDYYSESSDVFCAISDFYSSSEPERPLLDKSQVAAALYIISLIDYLEGLEVYYLCLNRKDDNDNIEIFLSDGYVLTIAREYLKLQLDYWESPSIIFSNKEINHGTFPEDNELIKLMNYTWDKFLKDK